ncbi:MAG: hypothetical protein ACAH82_11505 [Solirubrobacteraceae bacterium]
MPKHPTLDPTVVIRAARGSDGGVLEALARVDSQRPLAGEVLLAEQDGVVVAALAGERIIADPFRPTADVVALLRLHAGRSRHAQGARPRVRVPNLRAA